MRRLPERPPLPDGLERSLQRKTLEITDHDNESVRAAVVYANARQAKWFRPVTDALRQLAGPGERCMFCSGSECSQVEHFRPKERFPQLTMAWSNLLWVCGLCNNYKGSKFPVLDDGSILINPLEDNVWDHFFIDHFGNLTERWRLDLNSSDPRAKITVQTLSLDREALQRSRQARLRDLCELVEAAIQNLKTGSRSKADVQLSFEEWKVRPFQLDVANYFLEGPGREEEPFRSLIAMIV